MTTNNIVYSSTSFGHIFDGNTRSSFKTNISPSLFKHLDRGNLYAAVKSITFDNTYNALIGQLKVPHFIVTERHTKPIDYHKYVEPNSYPFLHLINEPVLDLESGKDYFFFNFGGKNEPIEDVQMFSLLNGAQLYGEISDTERGFTSLKLLYPNFVLHCIYMHPSDFGSSSNLIKFINRAFGELSLESGTSKKNEKLIYQTSAGRCMLRNTNAEGMTILVHKSIGEVLGFTKAQAIKTHKKNNRRGKRGITSEVGMLMELEARKKEQRRKREEEKMVEEGDISPKLPLSCAEGRKRERNFTKYLDPEEFGKISYVNTTNIKELLLKSLNLEMVQIPALTHLEPFFSNDFDWEYYYIGESVSSYYTLSQKRTDIIKAKPQMLGLYASYSKSDIFNSKYNKIVAYINSIDLKYGVSHIQVLNPTYYQTSIERLCKAELTLIDINTEEKPHFADGTPTYVHVHLKLDPKMVHRQFNVFVDSEDIESKKYFSDNMNTDFRIQLPQRLEFNRNWRVCLKSIFLGNDLFNIYEDNCHIKCVLQYSDQYDERTYLIKMPSGCYESIESIVKKISELLIKDGLNLSCKYKKGSVHFTLKDVTPNEWKSWKVTISPNLSTILGFDRNPLISHLLDFKQKKKFVSAYESRIHLLVPQNYIVMTDVVDPTIFGSERVNILKMLSCKYNKYDRIIQFDHYIDEFVPLNIKEFSNIRIRIADAAGKSLQTSQLYPTRLQLQFSV